MSYVYIGISVLIALVLHELAHGFVSYKLGDPTPKADGRLSLNPLKHLDPVGTICLFFFGFGWAKPVMIDYRYYKNKKLGVALVSLAGPFVNLLLGTLGGFLLSITNNYNLVMFLVSKGFSFLGLNINFYGLIIAIGMIIAIMVVCKICKFRNLKPDDIYIIALYVLPLSIIGARLYFVAFSEHSFTFWEVFKIWEGGMAIYGGVIGGAVGIVIYCLIHKKNFIDVADVAVVGLILGQAIGRIGCYFGGCFAGYSYSCHIRPFSRC